MRKQGMYPSYYKKYKYPSRFYRVTVLTATDAVEHRAYTGTNFGVPLKSAMARFDVNCVLNIEEITFDEYRKLITQQKESKHTTRRVK